MSYSFKDNEEAYDFLTPVREEDEEYKEEKQFYWPPRKVCEIEGEEIQSTLTSKEVEYKKDCLKVIKEGLEQNIQIEFPKGDSEDENVSLEILLRHYYTETQIERIKELVSIYQETDALPKMDEEPFIIVVAIAHLFSIFMIEDFKMIVETIQMYGSQISGFIYVSTLPNDIFKNYGLEINEDYYPREDRYVVKMNCFTIGMDTPKDFYYLLAELMPYKNKFGWEVSKHGSPAQYLDFKSAFQKDWSNDYIEHLCFQEYVEYWRE